MTVPQRAAEHLTVAVLTFRRPDDLRAALPSLVAQAAEVEDNARTVDVLVVDNDPQGSGGPVVEELASPRVRYVVEPSPGIAAARNRALAEAAGAAVLVFVDDDERPHPGWLRNLIDTRERTGAAAVAGAVVSDFAGELDRWVAAGDFFRRRRPATGTPIDVAATNNLLLDMTVVRGAGLSFDPDFGLSGGSDTLFTRQLVATGARMVWCDEAVVTDHVPTSRITREWVLRRAYRSGNSASRVDVLLGGSPLGRGRARLRALLRGLPRLAGGAARWCVGCATRRLDHRAKGLRTAARGAGMLTGAVGLVYYEYRRPPSSADAPVAG